MDQLITAGTADMFVQPPIPATDAGKAYAAPRAALSILPLLEKGRKLDAAALRAAMVAATGGDDAQGFWIWKDALDAAEIALVMFLDRHLPAIMKRVSSPAQGLAMMAKLQSLFPTHTKRSEESQQLQQFSTPVELAYLVEQAAAVTATDLVLEPSAGTGLLAVFAKARNARLVLNELGEARANALSALFPSSPLTRFNAEAIDDLLNHGLAPSVVMMNPPFSASPNVKGRLHGMDHRHVKSALARLAPGGRLVAVTSDSFAPENADYRAFFDGIAGTATVLLSVGLDGTFFKAHGTTFPTRLTVIDKAVRPYRREPVLAAKSPAELLQHIANLPDRFPCEPTIPAGFGPRPESPDIRRSGHVETAKVASFSPAVGIELAYEVIQQASTENAEAQTGIYEPYKVERILIPRAKPHPDKLVQSAAMASVRLPMPTYRPHVTPNLVADGLMSDAQLESVIYAGEAHSKLLSGHWNFNETFDVLTPAPGGNGSVQYRRGFFIGDGTGVGKGRQVAGIVLDNWLKGRRKALWISKSDKLLEDAQRDWSALGLEKLLVVPLDRYKHGATIKLPEGILFTTYATLRSSDRDGRSTRLDQIRAWLGDGFDGVIVFDEAHAMANAAGGDSDRGWRAPSQQGLAGLRLQNALPDARIVYVSATGATSVENLAYAQRLGLWGSDDLPFNTREEFVSAMVEGGIAAMEVVARDLKSLGLYTARSLTYEGVEVDVLEHALTPAQVTIYNEYAAAYQVIHTNLDEALRANGVTSEKGETRNRNAKAAARSAFEGSKQRFFCHLLTSLKMPTLIASIREDLARGDAAIVQLVSTSEALMERRLAQTPVAEWGDLNVDITPREYVLDYLTNSFPTTLFEEYTDEKGNLLSRPMIVDGNIVQCQDSVARRDALLERLSTLPPVQAALDQLVQTFSTDMVAEITGRKRRIVKKSSDAGTVLAVETRSGAANLAEAQAFMDDEKQILVFSDAGGTGRSYHADLGCTNQRKRIHYLLEGGWKADSAVQGLGRSNRTNQKWPPKFRPVTTNVRGERRFISTIARRLDSMGAITRGERKTGGQGMYKSADNLENVYAWSARRKLFRMIVDGRVACCSYQQFKDATGLKLTDADGSMLDELPPMSTFLNRILALTIQLQNDLFEVFEGLINAEVDKAMAAGTFDVGLETITAESLAIVSRHTIATHNSGAVTALFEVARKDRTKPLLLETALRQAEAENKSRMLYNTRSHRVALMVPAPSLTLDDGTVEKRVIMERPMEHERIPLASLKDTLWEPCDVDTFSRLWLLEISELPEFEERRFHIMTGLLLPMWKKMPVKNARVFRFRTDDGERVIGRLVPEESVATLTGHAKTLDAAAAWEWLKSGMALTLDGGITIRKRMVMNLPRYEVTGYNQHTAPWLKSTGCIGEFMQYQYRIFVPTGEGGAKVLATIMARYAHAPAMELTHVA